MKNNYRAYFFQNMYLSGIHAGIQSQHTTAEMFVKYRWLDSGYIGELTSRDESRTEVLYDWAEEDKTTIVLNGGMSGQLQEIVELLEHKDNPYPWAFFKESEYALNGALTNVGIILPERVYNAPQPFEDDYIKYCEDNNITDFEDQLIQVLKSKRLFV